MVSNITYAQAEDLVDDLENIEGVKQIEFDDSKDHFTGADALFSVTFDGTEDEQISKDALEEVKETLDGYDVYVSSSVGEEERSAESLSQDMNIILVLAVVIIVAVLMLSTKAYLQIPVLLITGLERSPLSQIPLLSCFSWHWQSIMPLFCVTVSWKNMRRWMQRKR